MAGEEIFQTKCFKTLFFFSRNSVPNKKRTASLLFDDSVAHYKFQLKSTGFQGRWFSTVCRGV